MYLALQGYPTAAYREMIQAAGFEKGSMVPVVGGSLIAGAVQRRTGCSCSLG
jgi:hypothetical protein